MIYAIIPDTAFDENFFVQALYDLPPLVIYYFYFSYFFPFFSFSLSCLSISIFVLIYFPCFRQVIPAQSSSSLAEPKVKKDVTFRSRTVTRLVEHQKEKEKAALKAKQYHQQDDDEGGGSDGGGRRTTGPQQQKDGSDHEHSDEESEGKEVTGSKDLGQPEPLQQLQRLQQLQQLRRVHLRSDDGGDASASVSYDDEDGELVLVPDGVEDEEEEESEVGGEDDSLENWLSPEVEMPVESPLGGRKKSLTSPSPVVATQVGSHGDQSSNNQEQGGGEGGVAGGESSEEKVKKKTVKTRGRRNTARNRRSVEVQSKPSAEAAMSGKGLSHRRQGSMKVVPSSKVKGS